MNDNQVASVWGVGIEYIVLVNGLTSGGPVTYSVIIRPEGPMSSGLGASSCAAAGLEFLEAIAVAANLASADIAHELDIANDLQLKVVTNGII